VTVITLIPVNPPVNPAAFAGVYTATTRAVAETMEFGALVYALQTTGFYEAGDGGGAVYIEGDASTPGGFTDAGGTEWELADQIVNPLMFGCRGDGATIDTAGLAAFTAFVRLRQTPGDLLGRHYVVAGAVTSQSSGAYTNIAINYGGNAVIEWTDSSPLVGIGWFWGSSGAASYHHGGGTLTLLCNQKCAYGAYFSSAVADGNVISVGEITVYDAHGHTNNSGYFAIGVGIHGAWSRYERLDNLAAINVTRAGAGSCTGVLFRPVGSSAGINTPILNAPKAINVRINTGEDADGIKVTTDVVGDIPLWDQVIINQPFTQDCEGRSIKGQCGHLVVNEPALRFVNVGTIENGVGITNQFGSYLITEPNVFIATALGTSFSLFNAQHVYDVGNLVSKVKGGYMETSAAIPRIVLFTCGAGMPPGQVIVDGFIGTGIGALAGASVVSRCIIEFSAAALAGAAKKVVIKCWNTSLPNDGALIGYTGYAAQDLSAKLGIETLNNRNEKAPASNSRCFYNVSGNPILNVGNDFRFKSDVRYSNYMSDGWVVDLAPTALRGDNEWSQDLATASFTNGPTFAGGSIVVFDVGHPSATSWKPVNAKVDNIAVANRWFYSLSGTWGTIK